MNQLTSRDAGLPIGQPDYRARGLLGAAPRQARPFYRAQARFIGPRGSDVQGDSGRGVPVGPVSGTVGTVPSSTGVVGRYLLVQHAPGRGGPPP